jgi:hypothetical protein
MSTAQIRLYIKRNYVRWGENCVLLLKPNYWRKNILSFSQYNCHLNCSEIELGAVRWRTCTDFHEDATRGENCATGKRYNFAIHGSLPVSFGHRLKISVT